jgi:hypothetical protein
MVRAADATTEVTTIEMTPARHNADIDRNYGKRDMT